MVGFFIFLKNERMVGLHIEEYYKELKNELNFHDRNVGIMPITLDDEETITEILKEYNYL